MIIQWIILKKSVLVYWLSRIEESNENDMI